MPLEAAVLATESLPTGEPAESLSSVEAVRSSGAEKVKRFVEGMLPDKKADDGS